MGETEELGVPLQECFIDPGLLSAFFNIDDAAEESPTSPTGSSLFTCLEVCQPPDENGENAEPACEVESLNCIGESGKERFSFISAEKISDSFPKVGGV